MTSWLEENKETSVLLGELLRNAAPGEWVSSSHVRAEIKRKLTRQSISKAATKLRGMGWEIEKKSGRSGGYRLVKPKS